MIDFTYHNGKEYVSRPQAAKIFKLQDYKLKYLEKKGLLKGKKLPDRGFTVFYEYDALLKAIKNEK